jgi:CheY-like chemotaxis protein
MRKNRRILIVDDEPYNILALQIILQKSGYPQIKEFIDSANNGQEAV